MKYEIVSLVCGAYQENAYLLCPEGGRDAVLIDPGDDLPGLKRVLAESGRTLRAILLTHGHFDHMLSAAPLARVTGCPVYVHAADLDMLTDEAASVYDAACARQRFPADFEADALPEDAISVAGIDLRILETPGHTPGSVCYYDAENARLFSGDTLFQAGYGRMDLPGGSPQAMRASLRSLFALPGDTRVLTGHGSETTIARERVRYNL